MGILSVLIDFGRVDVMTHSICHKFAAINKKEENSKKLKVFYECGKVFQG